MRLKILLATRNGGRHLNEQLQSIDRQTFIDWELLVSDDNSTDETLSILERYQQKLGADRLKIFEGPNDGYAKNFLSLVHAVNDDSDFYAFSDQDDIWEPAKLERAIAEIQAIESDVPVMYCSSTRYIDSAGDHLGYSCRNIKEISFRNALMQNIAGGNTMVFNRRAIFELKYLGERTREIISHDWMLYQLVTGCGGEVIFDTTPTVKYRQHQSNAIGSNNSFAARLKRLLLFFKGRYRGWINDNLVALKHCESRLSDQANRDLQYLNCVRNGSWTVKLGYLIKPKFKRQNKIETFVVSIGLFLGLV